MTEHLSGDIEFLREAADNGNTEAMYLLGICLAQGCKVEQDDNEAAKWFHKAAKKGHERAITSMGYLYSRGRGVRKDQYLAFSFLTQANDKGDSLAYDLLMRLRSEMSPQMLREAEKTSRRSGHRLGLLAGRSGLALQKPLLKIPILPCA